MIRNRNSSNRAGPADWLRNEKHILYVFTLYGLLLGIISYVDGFSDNKDETPLLFNFPTYLIMHGLEDNIFSSYGFAPFYYNPILTIPSSIAAWLLIGLIPYVTIRLYKTTRTETTTQ